MPKFDNLTLHTDFYEINMMATYFEKHMQDRHAVFEVFSANCHSEMAMPFSPGCSIWSNTFKT